MADQENETKPYDVIIIGGGPAGSSAAIYAARADLRTLVIDKGISAGALGVTAKVSNYPGVPGPIKGSDLVQNIRQQAESFGATFLTERVVGVDLQGESKTIYTTNQTFTARAIILATGSMGRTSSVPGEEQLLGRGVSYCATCDGAFFRNQPVAVIGSNDEALEETIFLTKFASKIELIVPTPAFKADEKLIAEVTALPKVNVRLGTRFKAVVGEAKVEGIRIQGRGQTAEETLAVNGVFIFLQGGKPITDYLMGQVTLLPDGSIEIREEVETSLPGVYAIGDLLSSHVKQIALATADGVKAAIAVDKFLHGRTKAKIDWGT